MQKSASPFGSFIIFDCSIAVLDAKLYQLIYFLPSIIPLKSTEFMSNLGGFSWSLNFNSWWLLAVSTVYFLITSASTHPYSTSCPTLLSFSTYAGNDLILLAFFPLGNVLYFFLAFSTVYVFILLLV